MSHGIPAESAGVPTILQFKETVASGDSLSWAPAATPAVRARKKTYLIEDGRDTHILDTGKPSA
jgi:hypothetical protein